MADRRRRRSLGLFRASILTPLTPIHDGPKPEGSPTLLKKRNPLPFVAGGPSSSPTSSPSGSIPESPDLELAGSTSSPDNKLAPSPNPRPRSLQKPRPSSLFGSLRSLHSEDGSLTRTSSNPSSLHSAHSGVGQVSGSGLAISDVVGCPVRHHGEIQSLGGMFRRRSQYLVLTDTHLVRFKTQTGASDLFPSIPVGLGKSNSIRHSRLSSSGSLHDLHAPSEGYYAIRLNHIVAIHKLDDGRPYFSIEIAHMDEETNYASAIILQLSDPRESDLWLTCIRATAEKARLVDPLPFTQKLIEYTARALDHDQDYSPDQFHMFKVVQRAKRSGGRTSSDDLAKLTSTICILAIGICKIHLIPLPRSTRTASTSSLSDMVGASHGIMTLTSLNLQSVDDTFQLNFRIPLRQSTVLHLAASCVTDIALWIRQAAEYLRPEWLEQPFTWNVPQTLDDELLPVPSKSGQDSGFDRTLTAYCTAYGLDPSTIRFSIIHDCEDAPAFMLFAPDDHGRANYSLLELLAIMRALRYNESFTTISFANINLDVMHGIRDELGWDHVPWTTRSGEFLQIPQQENSWLLVQEVQALALKSRRLRRLDFSHCLTRKLEEDAVRDAGCGLCEALFPLCAKQFTNVDWIILNGIALADVDIDFFYAAAVEKSCHFRALDLGGCGLMDRGMKTVLQAIVHQGATMESLDLSGNMARIDPQILEQQIQGFGYLRKINLSHTYRTLGPEPLIAADVLLTWKLECINLCRTVLNERSVDALSTYLRSSQSDTLRSLHLDQCQLTGSDLASILMGMDRGSDRVRNVHLFATDNRLEQQAENFVDVIGRSITPSHLTLQMLEYSTEHHFTDLINALSKNHSLRYLDISKASLPTDASDETCEALRNMFATNKTLESLDLSGEEAHLEVANLGNGLNHALTGLKDNATLRTLRIEHQKLGLQGASTLASVLEVNSGLREIFCENNEINLQAFTVLVNSLERNTTLLYLPLMNHDRATSLKKVDREADNLREGLGFSGLSAKATVKKTLGAAMSSQRSFSSRIQDKSRVASQAYSNDKEVMAVVQGLSQQWDMENARLQGYLSRNHDLAHGVIMDKHVGKPVDALTVTFADTSLDLTPRAEVDVQLGTDMEVEKPAPAGRSGKGASHDIEPLVNVDEGDDIEAALMMIRR